MKEEVCSSNIRNEVDVTMAAADSGSPKPVLFVLVQIIEKLHVGAPQEETNVNKFNKLRTKLKTKAKTHLKCWTDISAKSERKLDWRMLQTGPLHYFGRRLECQNTASSYLTPDFFPRLQVSLRENSFVLLGNELSFRH